jgi:hypothetical protein
MSGALWARQAVEGAVRPRQTSLLDLIWIPVQDGNDTGLSLVEQHYSFRHYRDGRKHIRFVAPGERMVLITPDALALFVWHKCVYRADDQEGVNCAVFRNEGPERSSDLIRAAMDLAWERWPAERLYTYVNPRKVRHKRDPGRCFLRAGWQHAGWTARGLRLLEVVP